MAVCCVRVVFWAFVVICCFFVDVSFVEVKEVVFVNLFVDFRIVDLCFDWLEVDVVRIVVRGGVGC